MQIYFKNGFYFDDGLTSIPESAVEITEELYRTLLEGQAEGKQIVTDESGYPQLAEPQPSPLHHFENGQWVISEEHQTQLKADQQAQVWELIKQKRYENSLGGVYIARVGKWFQTGEEEKTKYLGLDKVIDKLGEIDWKCADNSFIKMNRTLLDEIFLQMVVTENADHINAEKHRMAMMSAENPLEYDYSSGWAEIYEEGK